MKEQIKWGNRSSFTLPGDVTKEEGEKRKEICTTIQKKKNGETRAGSPLFSLVIWGQKIKKRIGLPALKREIAVWGRSWRDREVSTVTYPRLGLNYGVSGG